MSFGKRLYLEMTFAESSDDSKYMREVLRDWIVMLGPLAKKVTGYPVSASRAEGGGKLAGLHRFPELMSQDETGFVASFRPDRDDVSQDYLVNWGTGGIKSGFVYRAGLQFPVGRTDLLEAFIHWGLTKPELMTIRPYDGDYQLEQSETDLQNYEMAYGRKPTSPLYSDGKLPPLGRMLIDISKHPGRRLFRVGYIEAVSARMWLGREFWAATGASREAVLAAVEWLTEVRQIPGDVIYIKAIDAENFTSPEGHEAVIQDRLRALLYPRSQEPQH